LTNYGYVKRLTPTSNDINKKQRTANTSFVQLELNVETIISGANSSLIFGGRNSAGLLLVNFQHHDSCPHEPKHSIIAIMIPQDTNHGKGAHAETRLGKEFGS
jgi:hypothetical protein